MREEDGRGSAEVALPSPAPDVDRGRKRERARSETAHQPDEDNFIIALERRTSRSVSTVASARSAAPGSLADSSSEDSVLEVSDVGDAQVEDSKVEDQHRAQFATAIVYNAEDETKARSSRRRNIRRHGPLTIVQRERVRIMRMLGSCDGCRRRRVACHPNHHNTTWDQARVRYIAMESVRFAAMPRAEDKTDAGSSRQPVDQWNTGSHASRGLNEILGAAEEEKAGLMRKMGACPNCQERRIDVSTVPSYHFSPGSWRPTITSPVPSKPPWDELGRTQI